MAPSGLDPKGQAVFRLLGQNQAELAQPAVLCFLRPCKCKQSEFRVAYREHPTNIWGFTKRFAAVVRAGVHLIIRNRLNTTRLATQENRAGEIPIQCNFLFLILLLIWYLLISNWSTCLCSGCFERDFDVLRILEKILVFHRTAISLKLCLLQCYEVLWIHFIDVICRTSRDDNKIFSYLF